MNVFRFLSSITYTDYGEREKIVYGNGTETEYTYDTRRRMQTVAHQFTDVDLEREYGYDALSNITHISTEADYNIVNTMGQPGGSAEHTYTYDNYNRLFTAIGSYTGFSDTAANYLKQEYELEMEYDLSHNIISKNQLHIQGELNGTGGMINPLAVFKTSYNLDYSNYATATYVADGFGYVQPHAPRMIIETPTGQDGCCDEGDPRIKKKLVTYDGNGNQLEIKEVVGEDEISMRKNLWDEENRLRAVDLNPDNDEHHNIAVYTYDASGQRILRHIPTRVDVYSNAVTSGQEERDVTMIYPSGLITAKVLNPESWDRDDEPGSGGSLIEPILRYTKHYYIGTERISSATDTRSNVGYFIDNSNYNDFFPVSTVRQISNETVIVAGDALEEVYGSFGLEYTVPAPVVEGSKPTPGYTDFNNASIGRYFFHPDHLGSSSYITDKAGVVSQHMEYLPFGELLVDEHLNSHNSPFKFNAKELDPETGNYYYGARYYSQKYNLMLSVDPMYDLYPSFSPYAYTLQNPVRYVDPTGMMVEEPPVNGLDYFRDDTGQYFWNEQKGSYEHYSPVDGTFQGYYTANEFKEPVGDYSIIFDLSNILPDDTYNADYTITSVANELKAALELADWNPFNKSEFKNISDPDKYPGVMILEHPEMSGGITLGNLIIVDPIFSKSKNDMDHEYGHYLDFKFHFKYDKTAYLKEIGLPSLWSATKSTYRNDGSHSNSSTERRADILGREWARKNH